MYIAPLTFADIMETDLYYFDESRKNDQAYVEICARFCRSLGISQLPAISQAPSYFELAEDEFVGAMPLTADNSVSASTHIFSPEALEKFKKSPNNVLFVVQDHRVIGVTHICDYNKNQVYLFYYAHLLDFEKRMRELLILNDYTSQDMIRFFKKNSRTMHPPQSELYVKKLKESTSENQKKLRETVGEFQGFTITDLMWLARDKNIFYQNKEEITELRELRNYVMHGQDTVENDGILFNVESLERHFQRIAIFRKKSAALQAELDKSNLERSGSKNQAKWDVLNEFSRHVFQRSRLMWHYLES